MLTKIYSYCLFIKSKSAYDFTRLEVPLPCESNLRETSGNQIDFIVEQLINIEKVGDIIEMQKGSFPEKRIDAVLSVDAFSTSVLMKDEEKRGKSKNMFVYLLIPLSLN